MNETTPIENSKPKLDKGALLTTLKSDLKSAEILKKTLDAKIAVWIREDNGEPYGNETKGRSQIVSRDIKRQREWQHASLVDPFVSSSSIIKAYPITAEDAHSARQSELLLNTKFCRQFDRYNFMSKLVKVMSREGTAIIQTGWDYQDEEVEVEVEVVKQDDYGNDYITTEKVKTLKVLKNTPTAKICRNEDIYLDPTCMDDFSKSQFVIHRYETDLSTLRQDGRYKNLDKVAANVNGRDVTYRPQDATWFRFSDAPRKKIVVYEYWGNYDVNDDGIAEAIVCAWVGDTIIRLQSNPFPDKKPPFIIVPFNSVPFQLHGEANAELIGDGQMVKTAILRGMIDNMAQSNNGQVGVRKGVLDAVNRRKFVNGDSFEFNGTPNDFWFGSFQQMPTTAMDMLALMNNEIESLTGVKSFSGGINGGSLGATATGARGALDAASTRRLNLVRGISENAIKPLMRKWLAYCAEFMDEQEIVRITNEEYAEIRKDDLEGNIDIDIEISTAEDNAAKSQELSFLLQTVGPNEDPAIRREIMAQIMELMRMPDNAEKIRTYKPEPDPAQQKLRELEIQNLELENALLQAKIQDTNARANENTIDAELKTNKAAVEAAKARKLTSEADKIDLDFLKSDNGIDIHESNNKEQIKFNNAMLLQQAKHANELEIKDRESVEAFEQKLHDAMMKGLDHNQSYKEKAFKQNKA